MLVSARLDCDAVVAKYDGLVNEVEDSTLGVNDTESQTFRLRDGSKGRPITREFETVARSCMATGMSADACRQTLRVAGEFFLGKDIANKLEWPQETWYRYQREAAGNVAWLLVMVEIAGATRILQHGCDETGVSGVGTFSQWVLLRDAHGKTKIRVFECAGLLPGSTAEYITEHIKETWKRGREAVTALRERLGDHADELVPLNMGCARLLRLEAFFGRWVQYSEGRDETFRVCKGR